MKIASLASAGKISRRSFMKIASLAGAGIAGAAASLPAHLLAKTARQRLATSVASTATSNKSLYNFFTEPEAVFVEAAIDRLIPADEVGPGALELNVAHYIDYQLFSTYGYGEGIYFQGPFQQGTQTQGYQLSLRPNEIYRLAIADVDNYCRAYFGGKVFAELTASDRDKVLTGLEKGEISLASLSAQLFFGLLLQNTVEGYFCDPIYGGNKDMGSWKMLGFPGASADFRADVGKRERVVRTPISLAQVVSQPQA